MASHIKKKWIFYALCSGRFGNQLIAYAHLYAFWLKHSDRFNLVVFSFWPHAKHCPITFKQCCYHSTDQNRRIWLLLLFKLFHILSPKLQRILFYFGIILSHNIAHILPGCQSLFSDKHFVWDHIRDFLKGHDHITLDLGKPSTVDFLAKKHSVLSGFKFKSWSTVLNFKDQICHTLAFPSIYHQQAQQFLAKISNQDHILIGVHIRCGDRQSDSKTETNIPTFISHMHHLTRLFSKPTTFILTSDDVLDLTQFSPLDVHLCTGSAGESGHMLESIIALSRCHYLLINDTTFSGWASFINDVPLYLIKPNQPLFNKNDTKSAEYISGFK